MRNGLNVLLALFICFGPLLAEPPKISSCAVFPSDNVWNTPIDNLPLDSNSDAYVATIGATSGLKADFGQGYWDGGLIGIPFVTVPGTHPKYPASFYYQDESDAGPYAVPLNAPVEHGSDHHVISVDRNNCILYEIYDASPNGAAWEGGSGAIFDLKSHALRPAGWTSADAAGLPILAGLVRYEEIVEGEIRHAIRFTVPQTRKAFIWPARHRASSLTGAQYPPMGQRFRLKAGFDISSFSATNQVILRALKKYGMILADNGSPWFLTGVPDERWDNDDLHRLGNIRGSNFEAVDESSLMIDPDSGQARQSLITVTLSPASASVPAGGVAEFTATVSGNPDQSVTWWVNGVAGGNATLGWISAIGTYQAPAAVPSPATVTIRARSVADPTAVGSAAVTIAGPPSISAVSPSALHVGAFVLTVNGAGFKRGATVKFNGAALATTYISAVRLKATGTATAASSEVPVLVTSPDGQASNAVNVAVLGRPVIVTVTPASLTLKVGQARQLLVSVRKTSNKAVIWKVNGIEGGNSSVGTVTPAGLYTAPAAPGSFRVTATSKADPSVSDFAGIAVRKAR